MGDPAKAAVIARLRESIRQVQAAPRRYLVTLSTGVRQVDELGVFRLGGAVELTGEEASGRTSLGLALAAAACREKRLCAWVDGPRELYPPAAVPLGVELKRLLIVRPKAPGQLVWAAVQLLRSGVFTLVVLDVTHTGVRLSLTDTKKLLEAARAGGALLVVVTSLAAPAQGLVRLAMRTAKSPSPRNDGERAGVRGLLHQPPKGGEGQGETPLALVEPEPDDTFELEVTRSAQGGFGRRLEVPRPSLCRDAGGRPRRARRVGDDEAPGLAVPVVAPVASRQRVKAHDLREGEGGLSAPFSLSPQRRLRSGEGWGEGPSGPSFPGTNSWGQGRARRGRKRSSPLPVAARRGEGEGRIQRAEAPQPAEARSPKPEAR